MRCTWQPLTTHVSRVYILYDCCRLRCTYLARSLARDARHRTAVLPFGLHKGSGVAVICELLGGALSGGWTADDSPLDRPTAVNSMVAIVIDPAVFRLKEEGATAPPAAAKEAEEVTYTTMVDSLRRPCLCVCELAGVAGRQAPPVGYEGPVCGIACSWVPALAT